LRIGLEQTGKRWVKLFQAWARVNDYSQYYDQSGQLVLRPGQAENKAYDPEGDVQAAKQLYDPSNPLVVTLNVIHIDVCNSVARAVDGIRAEEKAKEEEADNPYSQTD
jgi:hypothetical protein